MTGVEAVPILELASVTIIRISDLRFRFIYAVSLSRYSVQTSFGTLPSDLRFRLIYAVSLSRYSVQASFGTLPTGAYSDTRKTQTPLL